MLFRDLPRKNLEYGLSLIKYVNPEEINPRITNSDAPKKGWFLLIKQT